MSYDDDVIFGRMGVGHGGDESEFDFAARDEADLTPVEAQFLFAGDDVYAQPPIATRVPPAARLRHAPSPEVAAALADSKARLAAVQAAYEEAQWRRIRGEPYVPPTAAAPADAGYPSDDGSGYGDVPISSTASDALQRFRESGGAVDPFDDEGAADDVLGLLDDLALGDEDEILVRQFERQITDTPADLERGTASAHRGAAYLQQLSYPQHGASGGQEGGLIDPDETFEVLGHIGFGRIK